MNGTQVAVATPIVKPIARDLVIDRSSTWRRLTFVSAACVTLLDAALLQRKHGVFTGGFLSSQQFGTFADGVAFLMVSALLNVTVAAPVVAIAMLIGRRLRLRPRALKFAALCAAVLPLAVADFVTYQVWSYLGDAFDFHVMFALTGRRISEIFAVTAPLMSRPLSVFALALGVFAGMTGILHRFDRTNSATLVIPAASRVVQRCFALGVLSSVCVTGLSMASDSMGFGLRWTPSGQLFTVVLNRLSDVDRDGYGLLRNPKDIAAFDPVVHPYAVDIPGNGIDENGLAGDLPVEASVPPAIGATTEWATRPPVLLVVLEGVRADVIGATYEGRRVTPELDSLAAQGVKVESAWSHAGSTAQSRYHIMTGTLIDGRGSSTLLDDFKNQGYEVAYFSGQSDDFGSMGLDYRRVDKFYDARQDINRRYSTSTTPGSLAVPFRLVEARIGEYLAGRKGGAPLFLYVNFHDTHYPYTHAGLDNLLGVESLLPSLISATRRSELMRTYLNAVANVDAAIGRVVQSVEARAGQPPAVVVVGDHGESLFEQGFLGHGFALNAAQTRVPLIVKGLPMTLTTPFGLTDLRQAIDEALRRGRGSEQRPVVQRSTTANVFQYLGPLETPSQIGYLTADGWFTYDFRSDRIGLWDSTVRRRDLVGEPKRTFQELVHTWENLLLERSPSRPRH